MKLKDGEPCNHIGCLNHYTHPCEGCGRIMGIFMYKKLKYEEYSKLAAITESPFFHTDKLNISTIHGIIGIQTEVSELISAVRGTLLKGEEPDLENIKEELGDIIWYISAITRSEKLVLFVDRTVGEGLGFIQIIIDMQIRAGILTDIVKKSIFYGTDTEYIHIISNVKIIYSYVHKICVLCGWDIEEIMAQNINKLKKRYPNQFNKVHAIKRMDKE